MSEQVLEGKSTVVTGAGGGIGRAIALEMARQGARVVASDVGAALDGNGVSVSAADKVVAEIRNAGGTAIAHYGSVADFAAAEDLVKTCAREFGGVDILVNVAGNLRDRMVWNLSEDDWDAVISVHLKGTFNTCRHAAGLMRQQRGGRIVNTTSGSWLGNIGQANYVAAKGGIVSLSRALALELGRYGVTCNCIAPVAATRMTLNDNIKSVWQTKLGKGLMTREMYDRLMATPGPEYLAPFVAYLASDSAANINGKVFHVEGGLIGIYSEPEESKTIFKEGMWTQEELQRIVPNTLAQGLINPAPPEPQPKPSKPCARRTLRTIRHVAGDRSAASCT